MKKQSLVTSTILAGGALGSPVAQAASENNQVYFANTSELADAPVSEHPKKSIGTGNLQIWTPDGTPTENDAPAAPPALPAHPQPAAPSATFAGAVRARKSEPEDPNYKVGFKDGKRSGMVDGAMATSGTVVLTAAALRALHLRKNKPDKGSEPPGR